MHTRNIVRPVSIGLMGAPPELASALADCIAQLNGCQVENLPTDEGCDWVRNQESLALVLVFAATTDAGPAVQNIVRLANARQPVVPVVVLAESNLASEAAKFIALGVADCLFRPINLSRLAFLIDFLTLRRRCSPEVISASAPPKPVQPSANEQGLVFASLAAQKLHQMAAKLATADATILLHGETGSGKSCLARFIHQLSPRRQRPFVVANCGSLPESLIESELFGHRQGAFTGADRDHRGKFAQADGGTLFLDEVDSLSLGSQSKLLRVVEDKSFEPIGAEQTQTVKARLVFATNRDLAQEVDAGRFRQDLYYRLNVISLALPPLRSRAGEIPVLAETFLSNLASRQKIQVKQFSSDALAAMRRYSWPGNLRELRNAVERVGVFCERDVADLDDLPQEILTADGQCSLPNETELVADAVPATGKSQLALARRTAERQEIVRTLERCRQNRSRAAESLGISRTAFYKKLRQLGIA